MLENKAIIARDEAVAKWAEYKAQAAQHRGKRFGQAAAVQVEELFDFVEHKTPWMTAPASSYHHMSTDGGLLTHSIVVADYAMKLAATLAPDLAKDSVILCGLFHDLGKVWGKLGEGDRILPRYVPNFKKDGEPAAKPYRVEDVTAMEIAVHSVILVSKFVDLTDAELQAIHGHDHQYIPANRCYQHHETPLMLITHYADFWVGHCIEGDWKDNSENQWRLVP